MKVTIFYSWQSDLPNNTNRGFIEQALRKAIASITTEEELVIEPCLERDTAGVSGTPDIASTIFRKIDECHVFVGDVSIINADSSERKAPNPNVLLELGYAAKTLTWDNVFCVFNAAFGKIDDLPFDLRQRRMAVYTASSDDQSRTQERDRLSKQLKEKLLPILRRLNRRVKEEAAPKPLTVDAASAKIKEYLSDERHRIQLKEMVMTHGNDLAKQIVGPEFPADGPPTTGPDDVKKRVDRFLEISQVAGGDNGRRVLFRKQIACHDMDQFARPSGQPPG